MKKIEKKPIISGNSIVNISLISRKLLSISIYKEFNILNIDIKICDFYEKEIFILKFLNVLEYSFYYNSKYIFYNIENYKIAKTLDEKYYLSLDPDDSIDGISENDQDFILSEKLEFYIE